MKKYNVYEYYAEVTAHRKHKIEKGYAIHNDEYPTLEASFDTLEEATEYLNNCNPVIELFRTCMIFYGITEYIMFLEDNEMETCESIEAKYINPEDLNNL